MNLYLRDDGVLRHEFGMGKSGSGKTQYLLHRLRQVMARGGGAMIVDAKLDYEFLHDLWSLAYAYGRQYDMRVVNIDDASISHTYNPLLRGDGESVTDRFVNTVDTGTPGGSGEHFKTQARISLLPTIAAIKFLNMAYTPLDLFILMTNPNAMEWLLKELRTKDNHSEEYLNYAMYLDSQRDKNRDGAYEINMAKLKQQTFGVAGRLLPYGQQEMGKVMNTYNPEVDLLEAIANNQIIFFMLPTLEKNESSIAFAKLFLSDLRSCIATIYRDPVAYKPLIPYEIYLDEFGSYAMLSVAQLFEMARGANIALLPFFQTVANLTRLGDEFAIQIMENTEIKTFLNLGGKDSRNEAAEISGEVLRYMKSVSKNEGRGLSNTHLDSDLFSKVSHSEGVSTGYKQTYDYKVRPEVFENLGPGESVVLIGGRAFKIKLPMVEPDVKKRYERIRYRKPSVIGLSLIDRFETEFSLLNTGVKKSNATDKENTAGESVH